jgi:hypothetical protein
MADSASRQDAKPQAAVSMISAVAITAAHRSFVAASGAGLGFPAAAKRPAGKAA